MTAILIIVVIIPMTYYSN